MPIRGWARSHSPVRLDRSTGQQVRCGIPAPPALGAGSFGGPLKIYSVKRKTIPKIAVLATGLAVAILAATIHPAPAQAYSTNPPLSSCAGCHSGGVITAGTTATAPTTSLAPSASYSVTVTPVANPAGGMSGYAIVPVAPATGTARGTGTSLSYTATMIAPASAGTFTYTVWTNQGPDGAGVVGTTTYSITVAPVV